MNVLPLSNIKAGGRQPLVYLCVLGQTDGWMDRQMDRQTDRQFNILLVFHQDCE